MHLSEIKIKNYRLLTDASLKVDEKTTLIVGRNNSAKTSLFKCVDSVLNNKPFLFNDYPISKRESLYSLINDFMIGKNSYRDLCEKIETISIEFIVDYSTNGQDDNLSALSPFIIDVDDEISIARIYVEYSFKIGEEKLRSIFAEVFSEKEKVSIEDVGIEVANNFTKMFQLTTYAINPNNEEDKQIKSINELQTLFPHLLIPAERTLGEDEEMKNSLSTLISNCFDKDRNLEDLTETRDIEMLRKAIIKANREIQNESDKVLSEIIKNTICFGYPNGEELKLGVTTRLDFNEQIISNTQLNYIDENSNEKLPNTYNGLGYKNLIKIEFLLASFAEMIKDNYASSIPLLFIEEPESHMHPQMQNSFSKYLEEFMEKISAVNVQTFLTSHSVHVANSMDFSIIRYAKKTCNGVIYKNLYDFGQDNNKENIDFIRKYLTLTKCDLFFADKAILVEGASERILIPDMINKCDQLGEFDSQTYKLPNQYYAILEVGGAYAHLFIPFLNFLGVKCLILTDIDSVGKSDSNKYKSIFVSKGETTSNETIKWWYKKKNNLIDNNSVISLIDILNMPEDDKTLDNCHIEFQTEENSICGRSLEEAIRNVNRKLYKLEEQCGEEDIEFKGKSKTDFALDLIYKHKEYNVPSYIKNGLKWLNDIEVID